MSEQELKDKLSVTQEKYELALVVIRRLASCGSPSALKFLKEVK